MLRELSVRKELLVIKGLKEDKVSKVLRVVRVLKVR